MGEGRGSTWAAQHRWHGGRQQEAGQGSSQYRWGSSHRAGTQAGVAHAELTGGAAGRLPTGTVLAMEVDDWARHRLITGGGGAWPGGVVAGHRGPEEVVAWDIDGGPGEDGGPEARMMVGRR
jgi:hypothetical protein